MHRDIKPGNLWVEGELAVSGTGPRIKILDFGLAHAENGDTHITQSGAILGTPAYMAPEQARGEKPVDGRADLFALGCVLYRLCAGDIPFKAETTMGTLLAIAVNDPVPLTQRNKSIPPELSALIMQLLEKDPMRRPQSAQEVIVRLNEIEHPQEQRATPLPNRRNRGALLLAGLAFLAIVIAGVVFFWQTPDGRVVRIECDDPTIRIAFADGELKVTGAYKTPITLKPGNVSLKIVKKEANGDDFEFETDKLIVNKGDKIVLKIEVVEGKMQIVQAGKGVLDSKLLPAPDKGDPWEKVVARMEARDQVTAVRNRLKELNPRFDETSLSHRIENGIVVSLEIGDGSKLKDLTPLRALAGLKDLHLHGKFVGAADIGPLKGMKLESFQSNGCPHRDLSPLAGMPLTKANFWGCATTDLSPLRGMKLVETNLGHSAIKDISVLKGMPLEYVCLNISHVEDLSPLAGAPLKRLFAANIKAKDLKPVANAPIEWLTVNGTPIEDYTPLKTMPLKILEIDNPQRHAKLLRSIPTLKSINHRPAAEVLGDAIERADPDRHAAEWALRLGGNVWVDASKIDIKDIADLPKVRFTLTNVNLVYKPEVTDASLDNLRGLKGLRLLNIGGTNVTDAGLIRLKEHKGLTHLVLERLKLTKTGLAHLKAFKELQVLHLHEVPVTDDGLSELMDLKGLTTLTLSYARHNRGRAGPAQGIQGDERSWPARHGWRPTTPWSTSRTSMLASLDLSETKFTDTGLARLKDFRALRVLWVEKTAVTPKGLADFRTAVPACVVHQ